VSDRQEVLDGGEGDAMPRQRYQDPKVETRTDVKRPFYFIRVFVPVFTDKGLERRRQVLQLGYCDEISKREANARKQQVMTPINAGKFLIQSQVPFSEILKRFREVRLPQLAASTRAKYESHIENHIEPAFRDQRMCDIDRSSVEAWLNEKAAARLAHWTLLDLRNILSAIFSKAAEWKLWQGENQATVLRWVGQEVREKKLPKAEELRRFLIALPETRIATHEAAALMVLTAATAGLRVSEVLGLQPRDVERENCTLQVQRRWHRGSEAPPKTRSSRRVRKIRGLAEILLDFARGKADNEYILTCRSGRKAAGRSRSSTTRVPTCGGGSKIYHPGFGMHVFRRLNITWRQHAGASPFEAQKAAGHARPSTTWMYTITDDEREEQHVDWIWERIGGEPTAGIH
jgi:integrase